MYCIYAVDEWFCFAHLSAKGRNNILIVEIVISAVGHQLHTTYCVVFIQDICILEL